MTAFECRPLSGTLHPDGEETLDVRFVDRNDLGTLAVGPWVERVLRDGLRRDTGAAFVPPTWTPSGN